MESRPFERRVSQRSISETDFSAGLGQCASALLYSEGKQEAWNIFRQPESQARTVFSGGTTRSRRAYLPRMFSDIRFAAGRRTAASIFYKITIRLVSPATSLFGQLFAAESESLDIIA